MPNVYAYQFTCRNHPDRPGVAFYFDTTGAPANPILAKAMGAEVQPPQVHCAECEEKYGYKFPDVGKLQNDNKRMRAVLERILLLLEGQGVSHNFFYEKEQDTYWATSLTYGQLMTLLSDVEKDVNTVLRDLK